ncbi:hypothetical protein EDM68_01920 [Candidatus Uhrbacteria bacterium]|nr:MAG: hypothetical protein EDM68_01920 [Candidatus Uhrbacteria bacterium]
MEPAPESAADAARTAFGRTLVPIARYVSWGAAFVALLATIALLTGDGTGSVALIARGFFATGLLPVATLLGLLGLLVLPVRERLALFAVLLLVAWLTG